MVTVDQFVTISPLCLSPFSRYSDFLVFFIRLLYLGAHVRDYVPVRILQWLVVRKLEWWVVRGGERISTLSMYNVNVDVNQKYLAWFK